MNLLFDENEFYCSEKIIEQSEFLKGLARNTEGNVYKLVSQPPYFKEALIYLDTQTVSTVNMFESLDYLMISQNKLEQFLGFIELFKRSEYFWKSVINCESITPRFKRKLLNKYYYLDEELRKLIEHPGRLFFKTALEPDNELLKELIEDGFYIDSKMNGKNALATISEIGIGTGTKYLETIKILLLAGSDYNDISTEGWKYAKSIGADAEIGNIVMKLTLEKMFGPECRDEMNSFFGFEK